MTTRRYYANAAPQQTLTGPITNSGTSLSVSGSFAGWPSSFPFFACLEYGTASMEIISVTNIVGTTATIVRGQDGTSAISHLGGATLDQVAVRQDFDEASAHTSSNSGVHGVSGNVVGTSDTQTLTNKTLTSPSISNPSVSGTASVATVTASGLVTANAGLTVVGGETVDSVTASKYISFPSYTNEAAANSAIGSPATPQTVYLSAPTGAGMRAGLYTYISGAWTPPGPMGFMAHATGPAAQTDFGTGGGTAVSITLNLINNRWYHLSAYLIGSFVTANGLWTAKIANGGTEITRLSQDSHNVGIVAAGNIEADFQATSTGSFTFNVTSQTSSGANRISANACYLHITDQGT